MANCKTKVYFHSALSIKFSFIVAIGMINQHFILKIKWKSDSKHNFLRFVKFWTMFFWRLVRFWISYFITYQFLNKDTLAKDSTSAQFYPYKDQLLQIQEFLLSQKAHFWNKLALFSKTICLWKQIFTICHIRKQIFNGSQFESKKLKGCPHLNQKLHNASDLIWKTFFVLMSTSTTIPSQVLFTLFSYKWTISAYKNIRQKDNSLRRSNKRSCIHFQKDSGLCFHFSVPWFFSGLTW